MRRRTKSVGTWRETRPRRAVRRGRGIRLERGDRRSALRQRGDGKDTRHTRPAEARPPRPCAGRDLCLRVRGCRARRL